MAARRGAGGWKESGWGGKEKEEGWRTSFLLHSFPPPKTPLATVSVSVSARISTRPALWDGSYQSHKPGRRTVLRSAWMMCVCPFFPRSKCACCSSADRVHRLHKATPARRRDSSALSLCIPERTSEGRMNILRAAVGEEEGRAATTVSAASLRLEPPPLSLSLRNNIARHARTQPLPPAPTLASAILGRKADKRGNGGAKADGGWHVRRAASFFALADIGIHSASAAAASPARPLFPSAPTLRPALCCWCCKVPAGRAAPAAWWLLRSVGPRKGGRMEKTRVALLTPTPSPPAPFRSALVIRRCPHNRRREQRAARPPALVAWPAPCACCKRPQPVATRPPPLSALPPLPAAFSPVLARHPHSSPRCLSRPLLQVRRRPWPLPRPRPRPLSPCSQPSLPCLPSSSPLPPPVQLRPERASLSSRCPQPPPPP